MLRGDAYSYAKISQDQLIIDYHQKYKIPYVVVRPGVVYGHGNKGIHGRVGIGRSEDFFTSGGATKFL